MITFLHEDGDLPAAGEITLAADAAHHARVRRVGVGERARLLDGRGHIAIGTMVAVAKDHLLVRVDSRELVPRPPGLAVFVPVGDKERMLMAAEKCAELQATLWQPVWFERSRSVSPRGEGEKFRARVRARMIAALEQSGGAWLPEIAPEIEAPAVWGGLPETWTRIVLDSGGPSMAACSLDAPTALAVGPEGGLAPGELELALQSGWHAASIGNTTLRFETAVIAGVALVRSLQARHSGGFHGS